MTSDIKKCIFAVVGGMVAFGVWWVMLGLYGMSCGGSDMCTMSVARLVRFIVG